MNTTAFSRRQFIGRSAAATFGAIAFGGLSLRGQPAAPAEQSAPAKYCPFRAAGIKPPAGEPDETWWRQVRARFDLRADRIYLNTGTTGPIPISVREARERVEHELAEDPGADTLRLFTHEPPREALAKAVNADADDIILTRSTTEGLNIFAFGLDLRRGDEVLLGSQEHSAAINPFRELEERIGIKTVRVELPVPNALDREQIVEAYRRAITPRSRLVVASHVTYKSGLALPIRDLADLAHSRGLLISVDGAQSFGVLPLDLPALGIDHYAAPGQKWLLAGTGTGFSWIRRDLQPLVRTLTGWHDPESTRPGAHTARRYEQTGQKNVAGISGIVEALAFRRLVGPERIETRIRSLATHLRRGLAEIKPVEIWTPSDPALSAGLTAFTPGGLSPKAVAKALQERHLAVRTVELDGKEALRVSTHFFNSPDDVDTLLAHLRDFAGKPALLA
ncbi:MAG: aminotransferase class V-fold PLP-dependent enzyme [Opitutaceae bacterium]|jgi:selenocysteine lyase/cysteine desulfurase|nr:aminotransferase class V-fold PLP-dependent enzyme [Opitutaceae bacterium]